MFNFPDCQHQLICNSFIFQEEKCPDCIQHMQEFHEKKLCHICLRNIKDKIVLQEPKPKEISQ